MTIPNEPTSHVNAPKSNSVYDWIEYRLPVFSTLNHALGVYPTPRNLTYAWNFGSLAGLCLMVQILTGLFLAMNYTAHVDYAFTSVERIMRDVNYGWLLRYIHAVGASMFFASGLQPYRPRALLRVVQSPARNPLVHRRHHLSC